MKKILIALILFTLGCQKKEVNYQIPSFKENFAFKRKDFLQSIADEKDFSVAFTHSSMWSIESSVKIFSLKNNVWEKIEFIRGLSELDTAFSENDLDIVFKEITLKKECRKQEAENLLNDLIRNGLFELPEEKELLEICSQVRTDKRVPSYADVGAVNFYIIQGDKVRLLSYQTFKRNQDCPGISEWDKVEKIQQLFENNWFHKKHY